MFSVQKNWITCPNTIEFIKTCHIFARTEEGEEVTLQENILNQQSYMYSIFILNKKAWLGFIRFFGYLDLLQAF